MSTEPAREHPRVPLTRFHNNTGEFLDLTRDGPVVLTSHGREKHVVTDSAYFRRLEALAAGNIIDALDLRAVPAGQLSEDDRAAIAASLPTQEELDDDRWSRHAP